MHPPQPHTPTSPPDKFRGLIASAHERFILLGLPNDFHGVYHNSVVTLVVADLANSSTARLPAATSALRARTPPNEAQAPLHNAYTVYQTQKVAQDLSRRWRRGTLWIAISLKCVLSPFHRHKGLALSISALPRGIRASPNTSEHSRFTLCPHP